jgi:transcriptional regulator with XRE-family HTH domain
MTLGEQLKKLRADKGVSQPELAELAGIEQSYLSKLENDKSLPSNEVFRKLLNAFSLSVVQLLEPFDSHYIKKNLLVISDIEQLYQQTSKKQLNQQRKLLYMASSLIVLAVTLFYIGYAKQVFSETFYEYSSRGIVLAGEPNDIFWQWRDLIDIKDRNKKDEKIRQMKVIMSQRSDGLVKLISENKGYSFEEVVEGGSRFFRKTKHEMPQQQLRSINAWLQVLGVLLFSSGIIMFVLERRLFKLNT